MMLVNEMHDRINLGLQKVLSNQFNNFNSDEIDFVINKVMYDFLEDVAENMRKNQTALEDVQPLIRKNKVLRTHAPNDNPGLPDSYLYEPNMYYGILPEDYFRMLNSGSNITALDEGADICSEDGGCVDLYSNEEVEYVNILPFQALVENCIDPSNLYFTLSLLQALPPGGGSRTEIILFDILKDTRLDFINGFKEEGDKYRLVNIITDFFNRFNTSNDFLNLTGSYGTGFNNSYDDNFIVEYNNQDTWIKIYWERYLDMFYPNNFIMVTNELQDILSATGVTAQTATIGGTGYTNATDVDVLLVSSRGTAGARIGGVDIVTTGGAITGLSNITTEVSASLDTYYCNSVRVLINQAGNANAYGIANIANGLITSIVLFSEVDPRHPNFVTNFNTRDWSISARLQTRRTASLPVPADPSDPLNSQYVKENRFYAIGYSNRRLCCTYPTTRVSTLRNVRNKLANVSDIRWMLNHPAKEPTKEEPLVVLAQKRLLVYTDGSFVIDDIILDYIRKPTPVSKRLGQSCEFTLRGCYKIVERAISYILEATGNPRLQSQLQLDMQRGQ